MFKRIVILLALSMAWGGATAELVATNGANWLRLQDSACTNEGILSQVKNEYRDQFKAARALSNGKLFAACWAAFEGQAFVIFEDSDRGIYPLSAFKDNPGI